VGYGFALTGMVRSRGGVHRMCFLIYFLKIPVHFAVYCLPTLFFFLSSSAFLHKDLSQWEGLVVLVACEGLLIEHIMYKAQFSGIESVFLPNLYTLNTYLPYNIYQKNNYNS